MNSDARIELGAGGLSFEPSGTKMRICGPYYRQLGFRGQFPEAEAYGESAITLPLYPELSESDQDRVIDSMKAVFR